MMTSLNPVVDKWSVKSPNQLNLDVSDLNKSVRASSKKTATKMPTPLSTPKTAAIAMPDLSTTTRGLINHKFMPKAED